MIQIFGKGFYFHHITAQLIYPTSPFAYKFPSLKSPMRACLLTKFDPALLESFGELLELLEVSGFLVDTVEERAAASLQSGGRFGGRL